MVFGLDYPAASSPIFSNVHVSSGWCFHPVEPVLGIGLSVNGHPQAQAITGYPRVDVAHRYPQHRTAALPSGFHCHFDPATLAVGENLFTYDIRTTSSLVTVSTVVRVDRGPAARQVSDVFIDIVGPCNLRCAMCPQGTLERRGPERGGGFMSVELFRRTLDFLRDAGCLGEHVNLYNWGDPLLHPRLGEILEACHDRHVAAIISTNLSFPPPTVRELTRHDVHLLLVSLSGFSEQTYARNHVRGDFALVRRNLESLATDRGRIRDVLVKYLTFRYNRADLDVARAFSRASGLRFGAYAGAIPSAESFFRYLEDDAYRAAVREYVDPRWIRPEPSRFCPQETSITINHRAELERCCVSWSGGYRASLFETDLRRYLDDKLQSDFCGRCLASGYSYYKHFRVAIPELLALADA
ncbi:MAG TPA: radical SAM protein [Gemmatimonadales bacterium]|nr:radical SAM protein [Gemmatimonadales bacterium]